MTAFIFYSGLKAEIDGVTLSINCIKVSGIVHQTSILKVVHYTFMMSRGADYSGGTSKAEWDMFEDWMSRYSVQLDQTPDEDPILDAHEIRPLPLQTLAKNKPGCPECWDTGFRHGFGAPCSHGCRP